MIPIRLNTIYGNEQFNILHKQFLGYKSDGKTIEFSNRCLVDYRKISDYLKYFQENKQMMKKHKMDEDDIEGWRMFNEMSDMLSGLLHFSGYENKNSQLYNGARQ